MDGVRDEHESEEQWALRREFIDRWKANYSRDRLLCLARAFINIEFMGCRYPQQVMQEIATMSQDVAKTYRLSKGNKLQRTFVSASAAAKNRLSRGKSITDIEALSKQSKLKILFVAQGHTFDEEKPIETIVLDDSESDTNEVIVLNEPDTNANEIEIVDESEKKIDVVLNKSENNTNEAMIPDELRNKTNEFIINDGPFSNSKATTIEINDDDDKEPKNLLYREYMDEMQSLPCLDVKQFNEKMFTTEFGKLILRVRPWLTKLTNIRDSCASCGLLVNNTFENNCYTLFINKKVVAATNAYSRAAAQSAIEATAWNRLRSQCVILLEKEQFIPQDSVQISSGDIRNKNVVKATDFEFGTPVDSSIAFKMMQLMGWSGGGLGPREQGMSEAIRPHMQQVRRSGLGSIPQGLTCNQLRRSARELMRKYSNEATLDADLVFTSEFSKEERAALHRIANQCRLDSKSYGTGTDRFLVVKKKKLNPFAVARAVMQKGGTTAKYQVYIPQSLANCR